MKHSYDIQGKTLRWGVVSLSMVICAQAALAATVTVDFGQTVGTQGMTWGTNEIQSHLRPSVIAPQRLAEIGSRCVRYWLGGEVRPNSSTWDWDVLDEGVDKIVAAGATPMVCFAGIPEWMAETPYPGEPDTWNHPRDLAEWGDYCVAIVQHCASRGYPVESWSWEIWNEPNNGGVSGGWSTSEYLELYDAAAVALRAAFPGIRIGGPSTDHPSENWIVPLLQGHDVQFITWHRYGAWDPNFTKSNASYLSDTAIYGDDAAMVEGWIEEHRPGEGILNVCGELNLNAYCCPIDARIWEPMMIPWYTSAMRHLLLNGCDVEQFFVGTDKSWPNFGLFLGTGVDEGLVSPAFMAKQLFVTMVPTGAELKQSVVSGSTVVESLATRNPGRPDHVVLINKTSATTPVTVNITGATVAGGIWYTVDESAYGAGSIDVQVVPGGSQQSTTINGYALKVLEVCSDGGCSADPDGDGILNAFDNCPDDWNGDQADSDGDGVGDVCDLCPQDADNDFDGDGVCANDDNCPDTANTDQADQDNDGFGDLCDNCPAVSNGTQSDNDQDGVGNACDVCPGTPSGTYVSLSGCPTPRADFDRDGDVDQADHGWIQVCLSGVGVAPGEACENADLDLDEDVDQDDSLILRGCMSGERVPADPACDEGS